MCLSTRYCLDDWFDLLDEFCSHYKYTKVMTITWFCSGVHFVIYPQQGDKIESLVLNSVRVWNPQRLTYTQILGVYTPPPTPWGLCIYLLPFSTLGPPLVLFTSKVSVTFNLLLQLQKPKRLLKWPTTLENIIVRHWLKWGHLVVGSLKKGDTGIE